MNEERGRFESVRRLGDDLRIDFDAAPAATTHAVYRGPIASFRDRPWTNRSTSIEDPENTAASCGQLDLTYSDEGECAAGGEDHYFLVAGRNLIGEGPLGEMRDSAGSVERPVPAMPCP